MSTNDANIDVESDITELVAEILETEAEGIDKTAHFIQDLGMDSMMALEILAGIEKKYRIAIPEEILPKFISVNATVEIVTDLLENK